MSLLNIDWPKVGTGLWSGQGGQISFIANLSGLAASQLNEKQDFMSITFCDDFWQHSHAFHISL